jgi:hypothetical protein
MTSQSFTVEKTSTILDETIHIMPKCIVHLQGHRNIVVPLMKLYILADLNNGVKFRNCTYKSTNDTRNPCFLHWVNNHHIDNKDMVLAGHVEINS